MKTTLLGVFGDYELARLARAKLLVSESPIDGITLTAVAGQGQSRLPTSRAPTPPATRDKFLASLRALFVQNGDLERAERLADRIERGAATVSARAHNPHAAARVSAVLRDCGALDIVRDSQETDYQEVTGDHVWPNFLSPAT